MKRKLSILAMILALGAGTATVYRPHAGDVVEIPSDLRGDYDKALAAIDDLKKQAVPHQTVVSQVCMASLARAGVKPADYDHYQLDEKAGVLKRHEPK